MPVSLCPPGSPITQPTGPHTQSTKLNLEPIPYHLPNFLLFFFTLFYNQKILNALPIAKQELPHTDVSEREKQRVVYLSTQQKTLRDAWQKGKRSLLIRGQHMKGLCRVKGNIGGVGRHIYCLLFHLQACRWHSSNFLELWEPLLVLERQKASMWRGGFGPSVLSPLCSHLTFPSPFSIPFSSFSPASPSCSLALNSYFSSTSPLVPLSLQYHL